MIIGNQISFFTNKTFVRNGVELDASVDYILSLKTLVSLNKITCQAFCTEIHRSFAVIKFAVVNEFGWCATFWSGQNIALVTFQTHVVVLIDFALRNFWRRISLAFAIFVQIMKRLAFGTFRK